MAAVYGWLGHLRAVRRHEYSLRRASCSVYACAQSAAMLSRDFLLAFRQFNCALELSVPAVVTQLKLRRRRRGCRAGFNHRHRRREFTCNSASSAYNREIPVVVVNTVLPPADLRRRPVSSRVTSSLVALACLNIRSLLNKFDDTVELFRGQCLDLLCITESWHDSDSAVLGRLRCAGFGVVDRPRPRAAGADELAVNHGGIVVVAAAGVVLSPVSLANQPTTFEVLCVRAVIGRFAATFVVIYRPGSAVVTSTFFDEFAAVLDRVAAHIEPVYIVGDFNIRLDRPDDLHASQLRLLVDCYGLVLHTTTHTHQLGGTLDAVISHSTAGRPDSVTVHDVGLSDHHLLRWQVDSTRRDGPPPDVVVTRPWRRLDIEQLRSLLSASRLCRPDCWPADLDEMAALYDAELRVLLDELVPVSSFSRKPRPSDPWFDKECRDAKRLTRRLERAAAAANRRAAAACSDIAVVAKAAAAKVAWFSQRRAYRNMRRQKSSDFWRTKVETDQSNPRRLWHTVDALLGRGKASSSSAIDVDTFCRYFADKVAKVRLSTDGAPPPVFSSVRAGAALTAFKPLGNRDVLDAISRLPDKASDADPMPTSVLKQTADLLAPYLVQLFNCSLATGHFPAVYKEASVTPVVKKPGLDSADTGSYRPISNLPVLSKLLERLVARQLIDYLSAADLLPPLQSGFRAGHSTETAVLRVLSDILEAVDHGDVATLILLDLSAAFDTVDHDILLQRLHLSFGIDAAAHRWFRSYLTDRSQFVRRGLLRSAVCRLLCGVPQGSVLGPILFILYTADLTSLIQDSGLLPHLYADDTQVYGSCRPVAIAAFSAKVTECVDAVASWMKSNRLQLNTDKTEVLWCATGRRQHQLPTDVLSVDGMLVSPVTTVRDLGIFIDADLVMRTHVRRTVSRCFAALRQLRHIRRLVSSNTLRTLVVSLVLSRLDYGNSVLTGLPVYLVSRLQAVLNASARLIFNLRRHDSITDALANLHWLRVPQRVDFKIAVLTYKVLHGTGPQYLGPLVRVADLPGRQALRSAGTNRLVVPPVRLATVGSRAFAVAAPRVWNSLPSHVTSATSLATFRRLLKTHMYTLSFPRA